MLEAYALACPVLLSNQGSLPEVGGAAAVYADPTSIEALALGVVEASFGKRRKLRVAAGVRREKAYTWEACAKQHLAVFADAARRKP